ncbi:MAG: hypothetical protein HYX41_01540 [Bdellovibrio sp.]|nr:hypothetical protein [Bdellovibrio sp.]
MQFRSSFLVFTFFFIFLSNLALANVGDIFGFGSRSMSLGGAGGSLGSSPSVAYHNPAALAAAADEGPRFRASWGFVYVQPTFTPINSVVTQNTFIADGLATGNVDMTYKPTVGQELGFTYRLFPEVGNFTIGLISFLPFNQLAYMDSGEAYVPEYFQYRARTQRPQVEFGAGAALGKGLYLGAGVHAAFTLTGNGTVFLNTQANTASSMRFTASMLPKLAPFFGVYYAPPEKPFSLATVFRTPVASDNNFSLSSSARVFGPLPGVDFNFMAVSALFYDPMALEIGGTVTPTSWLKVVGQVDWQIWNQFRAPAMLISQPQTTPVGTGSFSIASGSVPAFNYVNIVVPRGGVEISFSDTTVLRLGYYYRPSMIEGVPNGAGNYLDPATHAANIGLGLKVPHFLTLENPLNIDFNFTYQLLTAFRVTKTAGNEAGVSTDQKIGSPGYDVGGNLLGGGVSLSVAF